MKERANIVFIGGIHGVGKGYLCDHIISTFPEIEHLSSSEILKWDGGNNKKVKNVKDNQDKLVVKLSKIIKAEKRYILDGHFCLLKINETIEKVPFKTFEEINPKIIIIVTAKNDIIKKRLDQRDRKDYNIKLLDKFQKQEIAYAKEVATQLGIKILYLSSNDIELASEAIKKQLYTI